MKSLYESITQSRFTRREIDESITRSRFTRREIDESITRSRFTRREIDESILDDDDTVKNTKNATIYTLKEHLKSCNNVKAFSKLWSALGLDVEDYHWAKTIGGYTYKSHFKKDGMMCMSVSKPDEYNSIFVYTYESSQRWPKDFNVKKYAEDISKTLNMSMKYNPNGWYELKFKK